MKSNMINDNQPILAPAFWHYAEFLFYATLTGTSDITLNNSLQRSEGYDMPFFGAVDRMMIRMANGTPTVRSLSAGAAVDSPLWSPGDQVQLKAIYNAGTFDLTLFVNGSATDFKLALTGSSGLTQVCLYCRMARPWVDINGCQFEYSAV